MTSTRKVSIMCSSPIIAIMVTISSIITICSCCGSSLVASSLVAFTMSASTQQDVFAVTGGGVNPSPSDQADVLEEVAKFASAWAGGDASPALIEVESYAKQLARRNEAEKDRGHEFRNSGAHKESPKDKGA
jgi:hypothetical protein